MILMKRLILLFAAMLVFCACGPKTTDITLPDGFTVKAELAITPEETEKGLMYRTELPEGSGMLFVFEDNAPRYFWMKNTLIDLDIIFITSDLKVFSYEEHVPHSYLYTPDSQVATAVGFGQYVLELPAGSVKKHKIEEGSFLEFDLQ